MEPSQNVEVENMVKFVSFQPSKATWWKDQGEIGMEEYTMSPL